jgi:hypothetical protein
MSHCLTIPLNENGVILDEHIATHMRTASSEPFRFTDLFIFSHGWWTVTSVAAANYNLFSLEFSKTLRMLTEADPSSLPRFRSAYSSLAMGLRWPSMLSEDQNAVVNFFQAASFFTMEQRADDVGTRGAYALLRLLIEERTEQPPARFHLIGHSFGCRVVCSALQALANDKRTLEKAKSQGNSFNLALLQAAFDADSLSPGKRYGSVLGLIPNLRLLATISHNDTALGTWYPAAQRLVHLFSDTQPAMGFSGPSGGLDVPVSDVFSIQASPVPVQNGPFAVANITPLHNARSKNVSSPNWAGQHSDIFLPEIYELLARFFGN